VDLEAALAFDQEEHELPPAGFAGVRQDEIRPDAREPSPPLDGDVLQHLRDLAAAREIAPLGLEELRKRSLLHRTVVPGRGHGERRKEELPPAIERFRPIERGVVGNDLVQVVRHPRSGGDDERPEGEGDGSFHDRSFPIFVALRSARPPASIA
jgi:hypothetical protein